MKVVCIKPIGGSCRISSPFGERKDPKTGEKKFHRGIDFACPEGTPIRAVLDGKVIIAGWENPEIQSQGFGLRVYQECVVPPLGKTILVVYAHLKEISKHEGEFVSQSGIIGYSGNTGKSTGPHLHIGFRIKDTSEWLEPEWEEQYMCGCDCHRKDVQNESAV